MGELDIKELLMFAVFGTAIATMLYVDLFVVNRQARVMSIKSALTWTALWIAAALIFGVFIHIELGQEKALEYVTAYILEKFLSLDNLFVFLVIFNYFGIGPEYQPRVLQWGILGAVILRALLIVIGVELVHQFNWMFYVFGGILIYTAFRMLQSGDKQGEPGKNPLLRFVSRLLPVTTELCGDKFVTRIDGILYATPLLAALIVIESTDLLFALDSIPAVLGISNDLFIVYTSNIFAVLGLRSLYFALSGLIPLFRYLKDALAVILGFIGVKMILSGFYQIPIPITLGVIFGLLLIAIIASILFPEKQGTRAEKQAAG